MASDSEKDLVKKLRSSDTSDIYDALLKIRKIYARNQLKMKNLQKYSVVDLIIPFLEHPKFSNISLSIIADGCLELSFVNEVIKYDGIKSLIRIMKSMVNDDIQNRACRAIGNVAKFDIGFKAVHLMKPVPIIINFLTETNDVNCQQTAVRTLNILANSSKTRELIAQENGIICIAKLLCSSNVPLLINSTKAIANLTKNCNISCAKSLVSLEFHKVLVDLYSHSEKSIRNHALMSLKNLSSQEKLRSDLVKVGAVKLFTEILTACESNEMSRLAALAMCNCLDHLHMWSNYGTDRAVGLQALLDVLKSEYLQNIHIHVIVSLMPLSYESKVTDILLNLDVLKIVIEILANYIIKHKCKAVMKPSPEAYFFYKDVISTDSKRTKCYTKEALSPDSQQNSICDFEISKDTKEDNSYDSTIKISLLKDRPQELCFGKAFSKLDQSRNNFSSKTSDYSGSCSSVQNYFSSSEIVYEDVSSPSGHTSSGVWSPFSMMEENMSHDINCWSPVVSVHSKSPSSENDFADDQEKEDIKQFTLSGSNKTEILDVNSDISIDCSVLSHNSQSFEHEKEMSRFENKNNCNKHSSVNREDQSAKKKLKTEDLNKNLIETDNFQVLPIEGLKNSELDNKSNLDDNKKSYNKHLSETVELQTIDHYVILLILQLSFHIEKKSNSQIADKGIFSVLIDYLCFTHNPSPKAVIILENLIKNRYCFEKLILNGFICELEEKMTSPIYYCVHRSCVNSIYSNLIGIGRQEVASDYGIGTLSHILVTSNRIGQFHAICAMSNLVTEKSALYRLLFQANAFFLMFDFLNDHNISTRKNAIISICKVYQSLKKEQKTEKCCLQGTCNMKTSSQCSYKESFLTVTFSVNGGAKILANREKICENSEYFQALLKGHFKETNAGCVSLSCISAENLSTIFHFLHGCGSVRCCPYIERIPFSVLLELLSDCELFLLRNIKAFVEDRLCHHLLPSTVSKIYRQSKIHNSPELAKRALDFVLSINSSQKDTVGKCFEELINLEPNLDFLNDVKSLIKKLF